MPELPEVETIVRSLRPHLVGKNIKRVSVLDPRIIAGKGNRRSGTKTQTDNFVAALVGEKIVSVGRRGKNFFFQFSSGKYLVGHLKMTGQLRYTPHPDHTIPNVHTRVIFELSRGFLYYNDVRRFGYLLVFVNAGEWQREQDHGPEPLDKAFTSAEFGTRLSKKKKSRLKTVLLGQQVVVGLGNIYSDEVCFTAGVRPGRRVGLLRKKEIEVLRVAIVDVLSRAIKHKGSSISDYVLPDGVKGSYVNFHQVYGRGGEPCRRCGKTLIKYVFAGRATVYCKTCQK